MQHFSAFTVDPKQRLHVLITEVSVFQPTPGAINNIGKFMAIWDTGATGTVITQKVAAGLGLIATGKSDINGVAGSRTDANTYIVSIILPNGVKLDGVRVAEVPNIAGDADILIGMDIITLGDFSITNVNGNTTFSFRMPSLNKIDYVKEANDNLAKQFKGVGRNDMCPCGSGKKYKYCHEKILRP